MLDSLLKMLYQLLFNFLIIVYLTYILYFTINRKLQVMKLYYTEIYFSLISFIILNTCLQSASTGKTITFTCLRKQGFYHVWMNILKIYNLPTNFTKIGNFYCQKSAQNTCKKLSIPFLPVYTLLPNLTHPLTHRHITTSQYCNNNLSRVYP